MQAKGIVKFFAIALALVCLYQLAFTFKTNQVEKKADQFAEMMAMRDMAKKDSLKNADPVKWDIERQSVVKGYRQSYLDSISNETVYNLGLISYTYDQVKDNQISLGLDLQGGMSVLMQVSVEDLLKNMAGNNSKDNDFKAAIAQARQNEVGSSEDFATLFVNAYAEITNNGRLASIFATRQNQGLIEPDFDNEKIASILKVEAADAIDRTYEILNARIDQFGVTSPNISRLENSDRIFIELPGVGNPSRVRKLLQSPAKLQFWETYKFEEILQSLFDFDAAYKKILDLEAGISEDTVATTPDTLLTNGIDLDIIEELSPVDEDQDSSIVNEIDSNKRDSLNPFADFDPLGDFDGNDSVPTFDEGIDDAPVQPFLTLINASNGQTGTPYVGFVAIKDTAKVKKIFKMPEWLDIMPRELKVLWSAKPNANGFYELYAIKLNLIDDKAALEGDVITNAAQEFDQAGRPNTTFQMNSEGTNLWAKITAANIDREIAIVLDDMVYSAPTVNSEITGGRSEITGNFSIPEAKDLANKLKSGKMPAPAKIVQQSIVGPTLGAESIQAGVLSLISGLVLVLLFMIFYYSNSGIISNLALVINIFFIFGLLAALGATLTLPGIAGIVLTIGMAVDANVIIFERIREEILRGKSERLSLIDGYKHSYTAIIDANVTTLITAAILFYFGLGPVKGFATVLIIGICSSLFTAVLLSRVFFEWMQKREMKINFGNKLTIRAFSKVNFNFIGNRKIAYAISSIVILAGFGSFFAKGFELGVDFKGGRSYHVRFEQPVSAVQVKDQLTVEFGGNPIVKTVESNNELKITTAFMIDSSGTDVDSIVESTLLRGLRPQVNNDGLTLQEFNDNYIMESVTVKPVIADDIKNTSIVATIVALIGIFLYILLRFKKWQYSVGALAALAHDVIFILALFSIFNGVLPFSMEIDQAFIAAILTVIGYSINDTVIVFDRVREFLLNKKKDQAYQFTINRAINTTLSRTVITSGTTLIVMLTLFIFGTEVIKGFSFAILAGVLVGTYSSVFIATPTMFDLSSKKEAVKKS